MSWLYRSSLTQEVNVEWFEKHTSVLSSDQRMDEAKEEISLRERLRFEQIGRADRKEKMWL